MSDQNDRAKFRVPTITIPNFLLGMMAMNVLSGIIVALFLCAAPTLFFIFVGFRHPGLFKVYIVVEVLFVIGMSVGLNVIFVGGWCFNGLFASVNRRIVVATLVSLWFAMLFYFTLGTAFELGLSLAVLARATWIRARGRAEPF